MNKSVFWDRDGVLNHVLPLREDGKKNTSPQKFEDFVLVEGVMGVLKAVQEKGYLNILATKQPDIARNKMSWDELNKMHDFLKQQVPYLDALYVCPHDDTDNCHCRKPKPSLLLDAAKDYYLDLSQCYMIGDSQSDIDAAHNAGPVKAILIRTHYNTHIQNFDFAIDSLKELLKVIV